MAGVVECVMVGSCLRRVVLLAANLIANGQTWRDQGQRGWRRIVASPEPVECLDAAAAHVLLDAGYTVVCAGGGGVPVVRDGDGVLAGVEAVIDKDLTAALLARQLGADTMLIATDVTAVMTGWGTPDPRPLGRSRSRGCATWPRGGVRQRQHGTECRGGLPVRCWRRPGNHHAPERDRRRSGRSCWHRGNT